MVLYIMINRRIRICVSKGCHFSILNNSVELSYLPEFVIIRAAAFCICNNFCKSFAPHVPQTILQ